MNDWRKRLDENYKENSKFCFVEKYWTWKEIGRVEYNVRRKINRKIVREEKYFRYKMIE